MYTGNYNFSSILPSSSSLTPFQLPQLPVENHFQFSLRVIFPVLASVSSRQLRAWHSVFPAGAVDFCFAVGDDSLIMPPSSSPATLPANYVGWRRNARPYSSCARQIKYRLSFSIKLSCACPLHLVAFSHHHISTNHMCMVMGMKLKTIRTYEGSNIDLSHTVHVATVHTQSKPLHVSHIRHQLI